MTATNLVEALAPNHMPEWVKLGQILEMLAMLIFLATLLGVLMVVLALDLLHRSREQSSPKTKYAALTPHRTQSGGLWPVR